MNIIKCDEFEHRVIVARKMIEGGFHHSIVYDAQKNFSGVISSVDILRSLVKEADQEIERLIMSYVK